MKSSIVTFVMLALLCLTTRLQAQGVEKTLVQSLNPGTFDVVQVDLTGPVEVREWNNPVVRIQTTVHLYNATDMILQSLVRAGRYSFSGADGESAYQVEVPGLHKQVTVGGQELQESFSYLIYAPKGVSVEIIEETAASFEP